MMMMKRKKKKKKKKKEMEKNKTEKNSTCGAQSRIAWIISRYLPHLAGTATVRDVSKCRTVFPWLSARVISAPNIINLLTLSIKPALESDRTGEGGGMETEIINSSPVSIK